MRSRPHVGFVPHAGGERHRPDYPARREIVSAEILCSDVGLADLISVRLEAAFWAVVLPAAWLLTALALRTRLARVGFIDKLDRHPAKLRFVFDHVAQLTERPLLELLVDLRAVVEIRSDLAHIAECYRRNASLMERFDESRAHLVQQVRTLVAKFRKLFVLRADEFFPATGAALCAVDLRPKSGFDSVLVLPERAELAPVHEDRRFAVVSHGKVDLSKINACYLIPLWLCMGLRLVLGKHNVLGAVEVDLYFVGLPVRPVDPERVFATPIGEAKPSVFDANCRLAVNEFEVPLLLVGRSGVGLLAVSSPRVQGVKEGVVDRLRALRVQPAEPFAHPALHRIAAEPDALFTDGTPVACCDARPQITGPSAKTVNLRSLAELLLARQVHTETRKPSPTLTGGTGLVTSPAVSRLRGQQVHVRHNYRGPRPCHPTLLVARGFSLHTHVACSSKARGSVLPHH